MDPLLFPSLSSMILIQFSSTHQQKQFQSQANQVIPQNTLYIESSQGNLILSTKSDFQQFQCLLRIQMHSSHAIQWTNPCKACTKTVNFLTHAGSNMHAVYKLVSRLKKQKIICILQCITTNVVQGTELDFTCELLKSMNILTSYIFHCIITSKRCAS